MSEFPATAGPSRPTTARSPFPGTLARLHPGYFALVMATGIVSIAAHHHGLRLIAHGLLVVNVAAFAILWVLFVIRAAYHYPEMMEDLTSHQRGPGFFTVVAGTCVLGSQILLLEGREGIVLLLWCLGLAVWVNIIYGFLLAVTVKPKKPSLAEGINGSWLIIIVATQSVSILGSMLVDSFHPFTDIALLFALCMFLLGAMLYIVVITLIFYRFTFFEVQPERLTPPYWINMGAVAITTLAGATLILRVDRWEFLEAIRPFITGFTLFFWTTGTWWIPLLLLLGFWRHVRRGYPLRYNPEYWGMVFPLGMYSACTFQLARAAALPALYPIARAAVWVAILAWAITFVGLLHFLLTGRFRAPRVDPAGP